MLIIWWTNLITMQQICRNMWVFTGRLCFGYLSGLIQWSKSTEYYGSFFETVGVNSYSRAPTSCLKSHFPCSMTCWLYDPLLLNMGGLVLICYRMMGVHACDFFLFMCFPSSNMHVIGSVETCKFESACSCKSNVRRYKRDHYGMHPYSNTPITVTRYSARHSTLWRKKPPWN